MNYRILMLLQLQAFVLLIHATKSDRVYAKSPGIESYLESVDKISSFDILLSQKKTPLLKPISSPGVSRNGRKVTTLSYVNFSPDEERVVTLGTTRQVCESSGRRRIEINPHGRQFDLAKVFDGEVVRAFDTKHLEASIVGNLPAQVPLLANENRYDTLYSEIFDGGTFGELFESRDIVNIEAKERLVLVHVPPQPGNKMYPKYDFRLVLDLDHGGLPTRIETRLGDVLKSITQISRFHQLDDGAWVPIEASHEFYISRDRVAPTAYHRVDLTVDLAISTWNIPVDGAEFLLPFPHGTRVRDDVRGAIMVVEGDR